MTSLGRSTRVMAAGTLASRATGFLRTAVIAAALGLATVGDAYDVANTTPNIVYELLLGGLLTSVVVPLLVRAAKDDEDGGEAYFQRLLTLVVLVLGTAAVVLVVFAPLLVDLYASQMAPEQRELTIVLARFFLPQLLFYGVGALIGAMLNTRGRFGPPMWAPVLNNLVVIATGLLFLAVSGPGPLSPASITDAQVVLLGLGTTLGIVAQTVALLPSLRAAGVRLRLRRDLRGTGLGAAGRLAKWVLVYVVANQLAYLVVVQLATASGEEVDGRGYAPYVKAFVLWQLPHAVVAVSVITALLPRMSRAAADGRLEDLRSSLDRGLRLTLAVLIPLAAAYVVLGRDVAVTVFAYGNASVEQARFVGVLLTVFALGLVPFSAYQLQLRAFYALQDTRTPTLINIGVNVTLVVVDLVLWNLLPPRYAVVGLAAGHATSFLVGLLICSPVLARRTAAGSGDVVRTGLRCAVAVVVPALLALGVAALVGRLVEEPHVAALLTLALAGPLLLGGYAAIATRLGVAEVGDAIRPVLRRLRIG